MLALAAPCAAVAQDATREALLKRGKLLFIQCRACHDTTIGGTTKAGPTLAGFYGQPAASVQSFTYSPALRAAKLSWDRVTLDRWLERPVAVVPETSMAFAGLSRPEDRAALIAFLEAETQVSAAATKPAP